MKPIKQKTEFVKLRAEGRSYAAIADELHISKSTCTAWERELAAEIAELKQEQLEDLYNAYYMTKEARIKTLGETLTEINAALEKIDLWDIPPEKLLDLKLKYAAALKEEYISPAPFTFTGEIAPKNIMAIMGDLINRISAGDIQPDRAGKVSAALNGILKAYASAESQAKIEEMLPPARVHIYIPDNGRDPEIAKRAEFVANGERGPEYVLKSQPVKSNGKAGR